MSKKFLLIIAIFFVLSSCGFQVIYRDNDSEKISYEKELSTIRIQKSAGRLSQELRVSLLDLLNPDNLANDPKYILTLNQDKSISGTFITFTGASGRNKVTLSITYKLIDAQTGEIVGTNSTIVNDNYDVQTNRYGTYVADAYATSNLVKVAALNIRNLLVNDFIEINKSAENEKELATISVEKNADEYIQKLADNVAALLNKKYTNCTPYFKLELAMKQEIAPIAASFNSARMTLNITYKLKDYKTDALITSDSTSVVGDFIPNAENKKPEDEMRKNLYEIATRNIHKSLVDEIVDLKKKTKVENDLSEAIKACTRVQATNLSTKKKS